MIRVLLPLAAIAAILLLPIYSYQTNDPIAGESTGSRAGWYFVDDTVGCFMKQNFSIDGECEPKGDDLGKAIFFAILAAAVAAVLGVLGVLPFVGRLTSVVTTIAGVAIIAGVGYFCFNAMNAEGVGIELGAYVGGGLGLLTLIAGLSGMRGR